MEDKMSLHDLFKAIKKRLALIISVFLIVVTVITLISYFYWPPTYEASTQILINQKAFEKEQLNTQDIQTNLQLINTYNVIIKSPVILSEVITNLNLDTTPDLLTNKISLISEQNSQVVNVIVEDQELKKAVEIANMTAKVFQEEISVLMNVDNVTILSPALDKEYIKPISPNIPLNVVIAAVIGLMIGVGITFLVEYFDTTVKTEMDIQELVGIPVLGLISPITQKTSKKLKRGKKTSV